MRVVPNLYPAVEWQEVVVHSPRHVRSFAELTDQEIELVSQAWRARARAGIAEGFPYVHWLINEGRAAGSSLPHSHSQLVFLREPPRAARVEIDPTRCGVCEVIDWSRRDGLTIAEDNGVQAIVHPVGRLPYELLMAQAHPDLDLTAALRLVRNSIRRLRAIEGPLPWNAWLHNGFQAGLHDAWDDGPHVHVEVVPRLTVMAGLELGAGIYVNSLDPAEAAARLRDV